ncbi:MAG: HDOD domain-containing protein [Desulfobacterales bacterium]|nr:HDOD domain-containing protein [Desulfobacterales bacterium]
MKILIADDEMVSRSKLQTIMSRFGQCKAVAAGTEAIGAFEQAWEAEATYDLVMLDISMPDLDGPEVLTRIRTFERTQKVPESRRTVVVMVTSHAERDHIVSCLQRGCNDYIVKPFSMETIRHKMSRLKFHGDSTAPTNEDNGHGSTIDVEDLIREVTEQFERDEITLPTSPRLTMAFRQMILEGAGFEQFADLLRGDPAVAAELIRVSNSALYRGVEESQSVEHAIARLGTGITEQIVASICHRALFVQKQKRYASLLERLWQHSLATGHACDLIVAEVAPEIQDEAFTMGLLHDVGWLLLIQILSELELKRRFRDGMPADERIAMIETHHGDFGARVFEKWAFPDKYQQISRFHHDPAMTDNPTTDLWVVHLANLLAINAGFAIGENADAGALHESDAAQRLNLSEESLAAMGDQLQERMAALDGLLA